jgi:hypothetical protein
VNVSPEDSGRIEVNGVQVPYYPYTQVFSRGETVQVKAIPLGQNVFQEWSGCQGGSANPLSLVMDPGKSIVAHFLTNSDNPCEYEGDEDPCDDGDPCTTDSCLPETGCSHVVDMDSDLDGFIDKACPGGTDCDDSNASIHPHASETPGDGVDMNCGPDACEGGPVARHSACDNCGTMVFAGRAKRGNVVLNLLLYLLPLIFVGFWRRWMPPRRKTGP